jgi:DNA invertase Pin-like site-specific DNA recombinase
MREIRRIEPSSQPIPARKRAAAYARVSGGKDAMLNSLSAQVSYYSGYIQKQRGWEYVGVYADEAMTGTKDTRPEFQRLMSDCRDGKIDIVITKSISRFARNTVTMLEAVRELRSLNIDVWFERENIHSLSGDGELMLTILASFAQEESRSASDNIKWRLRNKFKDGRPSSTVIMGYKLVDGKFYIVPEEAEIVRMIFADFLGGMGKNAIMKKLTAMGVPTKRGGNWNENVIDKMLRNEKYQGDLLLQKRFTEDHITKKQRFNKGELPMYYVENSHEPIIDKDTFAKVQAELARRAALHLPSKKTPEAYPFTGKIICGLCGKNYRRKTTAIGTPYERVVWICGTFNSRGKDACPSQQIPEDILLEIVGEDFESGRVPEPNALIIVMPDGSEIERRWQHKSRRESWTEEKRERARVNQLEYLERRRANASGSQND